MSQSVRLLPFFVALAVVFIFWLWTTPQQKSLVQNDDRILSLKVMLGDKTVEPLVVKRDQLWSAVEFLEQQKTQAIKNRQGIKEEIAKIERYEEDMRKRLEGPVTTRQKEIYQGALGKWEFGRQRLHVALLKYHRDCLNTYGSLLKAYKDCNDAEEALAKALGLREEALRMRAADPGVEVRVKFTGDKGGAEVVATNASGKAIRLLVYAEQVDADDKTLDFQEALWEGIPPGGTVRAAVTFAGYSTQIKPKYRIHLVRVEVRDGDELVVVTNWFKLIQH